MESPLKFIPLSETDIPRLRPILQLQQYRSCDFTVGGLFLWKDYFHYKAATYNDTLFIKGVTENDLSRPAFSLPVGAMSINDSIDVLREYCRREKMPLILSAVPEEALDKLMASGAKEITELNDWADYVYDIDSLATFSGKKLSKKRNHLNRFAAEWSDAEFRAISSDDSEDLIHFVESLPQHGDKPSTAEFDRQQTLRVLTHMESYRFCGGILTVPDRGIAAFTFGETLGDTLHVHIEKIDHSVIGAGETICNRYVRMMQERHNELRYVNRQDDSGDPGLRQAKQALNPAFMIRKYNVAF